MTKPIIGITANVRPNPAHEDINWSYAPSGFVEGVQRAGGLAILLPVSDPSEAKNYISMIDKLILIGGQNVDPKFYNEENHASEDDFFLERDIFEMALIEEATKQKKPIFSICRGTQLMNVALGGSLHQDIEHHWQDKPSDYLYHEMIVDERKIRLKQNPEISSFLSTPSTIKVSNTWPLTFVSLRVTLRITLSKPLSQIHQTFASLVYSGTQSFS